MQQRVWLAVAVLYDNCRERDVLAQFCFHTHAGVSLMLSGATIPNDSIVDLDDMTARGNDPPSDTTLNGVLLCLTDLQDCCDTPPNVRGDWYFPDDSRVESSDTEFQVNRGASVVRLWRRYSTIPEMGIGHFRCRIPNAANSNINIYANICEFQALLA